MKALSAFIARRERTYLWANVADVALTLLRNGIAYAYLIRQTLVHGWPASTFCSTLQPSAALHRG